MDRINKLKELIKKKNLNFAIINDEKSLNYFTGLTFLNETSYLLVGKEKAILLVSELDEAIETKNFVAEKYSNIQELVETFENTIKKNSKIGFHVKLYKSYNFLKKSLKNSKLIDIREDVLKMRSIKDSYEVEKIKKATTVTKNAINYGFSKFKKGMTEKDLASEIKSYITSKGMDYNFCNVQADENSAIPHHLSDKTKIKRIIAVDVGAVYKGYGSDITRTFLLKPTSKMKKIYKIVKEAQKKSLEAIKENVKAERIDNIARDYIKEKGYELIHSLGHGVGLEYHGMPKISSRSDDVIKENMVFTLEPGIYLPAEFGIRIEDVVVATKKSYKIL